MLFEMGLLVSRIPIGAGDTYGNPSQVIDVQNDGTTISCEIIPMQWACNNVPCECNFVMTYKLQGSSVLASVTLDNHRSDQGDTEYRAYDQEFPAVYVNGFLYRLLTYTGAQPWTNQPLEELECGFENNFWVPGKMSTTESFSVFANSDDFGVGIYSPEHGQGMLGGFVGKKGSGGTSDSAAGYLAPVDQLALEADSTVTYDYVLLMGNVDQIRGTVYALHEQQVAGKSLRESFEDAVAQ
jgi:hypothetical protein